MYSSSKSIVTHIIKSKSYDNYEFSRDDVQKNSSLVVSALTPFL